MNVTDAATWDACGHTIFVYDSDHEQREMAAQFTQQGLLRSQAVFYVADRRGKSSLRALARQLRGKVPVTLGVLKVLPVEEVYLIDGVFDPKRTYAKWRSLASEAMDAGFTEIRLAGEMGWALRGWPHSERLLEYELAVGEALERVPVTALCLYDRRLFPSECISVMMDAHPQLLFHGSVYGTYDNAHQRRTLDVATFSRQCALCATRRQAPAGQAACNCLSPCRQQLWLAACA